ncbi:MAG: hypothetical protein EON47_15070, partial [Acetobacteraceae bacterium]
MDVGPASSPRAALRRPLLRRLRPLAAGLAILALLAAAGWYVHRFMTLVFVDDARVAADMITVSSRVPGIVDEDQGHEAMHIPAGRRQQRQDRQPRRQRPQPARQWPPQRGPRAAS